MSFDPRDARIAELEQLLARALARIVELEAKVAELSARLGQNSQNSSALARTGPLALAKSGPD